MIVQFFIIQSLPLPINYNGKTAHISCAALNALMRQNNDAFPTLAETGKESKTKPNRQCNPI